MVRDQENPAADRFPSRGTQPSWGAGFRWAASKWGFAASMIAFTWTLQGRIAEIGGVISVILWLALNFSFPKVFRPGR
jgi:hypothetical protein